MKTKPSKRKGAAGKSRRITIEPKGISVVYEKCPTCAKLRPDEDANIINPDDGQCRYCRGIEWGNEYRRTHPVKNSRKKFQAPRPRAKAKVRRSQ